MTTDHDDRVSPFHSLKFIAELQVSVASQLEQGSGHSRSECAPSETPPTPLLTVASYQIFCSKVLERGRCMPEEREAKHSFQSEITSRAIYVPSLKRRHCCARLLVNSSTGCALAAGLDRGQRCSSGGACCCVTSGHKRVRGATVGL